MVWTRVDDEKNTIFLTEGYIPPLDYLARVFPGRHYRSLSDKMPDEHEEAIAWIFTAYAQTLYLRNGMSSGTRVPVDTWLIGSPKSENAELEEWFKGESSDTRYRIFVHRQPRRNGSSWFGSSFEQPHTRLGTKHRTGKYADLKRQVRPLLVDVLHAYREELDTVEQRIAQTNHSYAYSRGLIQNI